jgi:hypothetical protein
VRDGRATQRLKPLLEVEVSRVEQEDAVRGSPVASGAPALLNILLQSRSALAIFYAARWNLGADLISSITFCTSDCSS